MRMIIDNYDIDEIKTLFVAGGSVYSNEISFIKEFEGQIVCADSGCNNVLLAGRLPDIAVGDMDSIDKENYDLIKTKEVKIINFPTDKDKLDSEILFDIVNTRGLFLLGFTGTRPDQTFAGYVMIYKYRDRLPVMIADNFMIFSLSDSLVINDALINSIFSVASPFGKAVFESSEGLKYSLNELVFDCTDIYGISNEIIDSNVRVKIKEGSPVVFVQYGK